MKYFNVSCEKIITYNAAFLSPLIFSSCLGIAIAIPHSASDDELRTLFSMVNGVIFPGGGTDLYDNRYRDALDVLYDEAVNFNTSEDIASSLFPHSPPKQSFPLWGTCLGFQYLAIKGNDGARDTLGDFLAQNISLPVENTPAMTTSRLFSHAHPIERTLMIQHMANAPATANVHYHGFAPTLFQTSPSMARNFNLLGTSVGQDGKEFVAIMESPRYPFFGVQFHPERSLFEWADKENIVKEYETVRLQHYFGSVLVAEARKNSHKFPSRKVENMWNINAFPSKLAFGPYLLDEEDQGYYFFSHSDFPLHTLH